jgi:hypothetical protein
VDRKTNDKVRNLGCLNENCWCIYTNRITKAKLEPITDYDFAKSVTNITADITTLSNNVKGSVSQLQVERMVRDIKKNLHIDTSKDPTEEDIAMLHTINIGVLADYDFEKISKAVNNLLASFKKK